MPCRLQDYRDRPEEFRSFKKEVCSVGSAGGLCLIGLQVKEMLNTSMEGTSNKIERNIGLMCVCCPVLQCALYKISLYQL